MKILTAFRLHALFSIALLSALLAACSPPAPSTPGQLSLTLLSGKPQLVTGGTALIEVQYRGESEAAPRLQVNGSTQPDAFQALAPVAPGERRYLLSLAGLAEGENTIHVQLEQAAASLGLVNYPVTGPVISGPALSPYFCLPALVPAANGEPQSFPIGNGELLDTSAMDDNCHLPSRTDYVYRAVGDEGFLPLPDSAAHPQDVQWLDLGDGERHPYIVRIETGTINRAIYQIAILHDPLSTEPSAAQPSAGWNQRLVYTFGGGCEAGFFQGTSTGGVLRDLMLAQGYAVASSTLNVNAQGGCNDVLSAETAMMVKEHFITRYGMPDFTMGSGASGGAMQQLLIAGAYPGILDGLVLGMTFPDAVSYFVDSQECNRWRAFANDPERALPESVRAVLGGWPNWYLCDESLGSRPDRVSPYDCPAVIPTAARYDAEHNPDGVRCSIYDGMRNIFGSRQYEGIAAGRPVARSPHDNVGVQYGLEALNAGLIDVDLFLDINEAFGGWDLDGQAVPTRMEADEEAVRIAYETGRVVSGGAGLAQVPIIDSRLYLDDEGNFHASVYSFVTRARLERDNGHAGNYVIRRHDRNTSLDAENLLLMDQWLTALHRSGRSPDPDLLASLRPEALADDCFTAAGERIVEPASFDMERLFDNGGGACNALYPPHAGLRLVAGGPLTNDVLQCQRKAIDHEDYRVAFSEEQIQRLEGIFPFGVCDWSQPGQHQYVNDTWLSFGPSPVNRYQSPAE